MRWIYVSPHLDDAALCAGGLIFDQTRVGLAVEIWTCMSGIPNTEALSRFAQKMHARWRTTGARETMKVRREENRQAAAVLGAKAVDLDFTDALYRRGPGGSILYGDPVGARVDAADAGLPAALAGALRQRLRDADEVVCPLGIGSHVDHVLVREAAEMLGRRLHFVADIPYVLVHPHDEEEKTWGLNPTVRAISEAGQNAWIESIAAYRSQLSSLYESWEGLQKAIRDRCSRTGGVRVWIGAEGPRGLDSGANP